MFAMLPPGAKLGRHRDPFAGSLRYHLGLVTPNSDDCRIYVDGKMYSWRDGEAVLFDETFIHWAENATQTARIILFCDVERPLHTGFARAANRFFGRTFVAAAATANEPGEKVGVLNRIFGFFHRMRAHTTRLKNWNRFVYYTLQDPGAGRPLLPRLPRLSAASTVRILFAARWKRLLRAATVVARPRVCGRALSGPFGAARQPLELPGALRARLHRLLRRSSPCSGRPPGPQRQSRPPALALAPVVPWYFGAGRGPCRSVAAVGEIPRVERLLREPPAPAHPGTSSPRRIRTSSGWSR
mgnify:CR=1 FL=1